MYRSASFSELCNLLYFNLFTAVTMVLFSLVYDIISEFP